MSSILATVAVADRKDLNPSIGPSFDSSVVLFNYIIQVFDLTDFDVRLMVRVVAFDRRRVGPALIDRDLLRGAMRTDRLA
jgi:hypothetical protein